MAPHMRDKPLKGLYLSDMYQALLDNGLKYRLSELPGIRTKWSKIEA